MMRKTVLLLCLAGLFSCSNPPAKKSNAEEMNLKGNVQTMFTLAYEAIDKFGEGNITRGKLKIFGNQLIEFDSLGNTLYINSYYIKNEIPKYKTEYDLNGYQIKFISYDDNTGKERFINTHKNDASGKVLEKINKDGDKTIYTYDNDGKLIEEKSRLWKSTYKYDERGNMIEEYYGALRKIYKFEYDSLNRCIIRRFPDGDYRENKYDENGNLIETVFFKKERNGEYSIGSKSKYAYNNKKERINYREWNSEGELTDNDRYFYCYKDTFLISSIQIDKDEVIQYIEEYTYHDDSKKIKSDYIPNLENELFYKRTYHYENGLLSNIRSSTRDDMSDIYIYQDGKLIKSIYTSNGSKTTTLYNKQGKAVEEKTEEDGEVTYILTYKYRGNEKDGSVEVNSSDIKNNTNDQQIIIIKNGVTTEINYISNGIESRITYEHNEHNDVIKEFNSKDNSTTTYEYDYDPKGNWTRRITFVNGKADAITERAIAYFDE